MGAYQAADLAGVEAGGDAVGRCGAWARLGASPEAQRAGADAARRGAATGGLGGPPRAPNRRRGSLPKRRPRLNGDGQNRGGGGGVGLGFRGGDAARTSRGGF